MPLVAVAALYLCRAPLLAQTAAFLVIRDRLEPADVVMVLNGDPNSRPFYACDLYRRKLAPKLLIARAESSPIVGLNLIPNTTDLTVGVLRRLGVPEGDLVQAPFPGGVTSTFDEARVLRDYSQAHGVRSAIVVTSAFHSRRAKWIMETTVPRGVRIMMSPIDDQKYNQNNWWHREDGLIACQNEYIKLLFYRLRYRRSN
jgi:uncharacterized SAM-binding protein YcdF (DUF218 family)